MKEHLRITVPVLLPVPLPVLVATTVLPLVLAFPTLVLVVSAFLVLVQLPPVLLPVLVAATVLPLVQDPLTLVVDFLTTSLDAHHHHQKLQVAVLRPPLGVTVPLFQQDLIVTKTVAKRTVAVVVLLQLDLQLLSIIMRIFHIYRTMVTEVAMRIIPPLLYCQLVLPPVKKIIHIYRTMVTKVAMRIITIIISPVAVDADIAPNTINPNVATRSIVLPVAVKQMT